MLARNCLFIVVCLAGAGLVANTLFRRERVSQPRLLKADPDCFATSLDKLNAEFQKSWHAKGLEAAPRADDLTIARRLSLALIGTVPSLEEIRAFEAIAPVDRIGWWT